VLPGHVYGFFTLATDNTGNVEPPKSAPDASVTVGTPGLTDAPPALAPLRTALYQNAPNPGRSGTVIHFDLATEGAASLEIFDLQGRLVDKPLDLRRLPAGRHQVQIRGGARAAGVDFYRLTAGGFRQTRRMVILK